MLPNFLIIGAAKAGTTSLHDYLAQHPEIYMSPVKELSYFKQPRALRGRSRFHVRTLEEYTAHFDGVRTETAVGEASPAYLTSADAAKRIREALPDARLIAILRQPAERAFSDYAMHVANGHESLSFTDAIAAELREPADNRRRYVRNGMYAAQLAAYFELFEPNHLRVCFYDDLESDALELVRDLYSYLDVSPAFVPDVATRHNARRPQPKHRRLNRASRLPSVKAIRRIVPRRVRQGAKRWARRQGDTPLVCTPVERREVTELFRQDIEVLEQLTARDLSAWLA